MVARSKVSPSLTTHPPAGMLIDAHEAAAKLAISVQTVWAMAKRGDLPCVRFGERIVRFDPIDLDAWIFGRKSSVPVNL
jgi:excisionase family DNA binding protein